MRKLSLLAGGAAALCLLAGAASAATYTFVGSWAPDDGPYWGTDPIAYSGVAAAALLFGGAASDYAISTVDDNPNDINFMANYEMVGVGSFVFAQDYFRGVDGVTHYQDVYVFDQNVDTVSTYVSDFSNGRRNYAFRIDNAGGVPEPMTWALMIPGFGLAGAALRRRRPVTAG